MTHNVPNRNWSYPTAIKFGVGRIAELAEHCRAAGIAKPLFVTDRALASLPITAEAVAVLSKAGLGSAVFSEVDPNPNEGNMAAGIAAYKAGGHDGVICFGGGSALDLGKMIALMAHQRSVTALKEEIGPWYDLSALWDKHCEYEFATRNVDDTMATMVAEPYVNHIPTMTGGVGYKDLYRFYKHHFVNSNPPDTSLIPISRTVGKTGPHPLDQFARVININLIGTFNMIRLAATDRKSVV
mgnify:CR=1 FL=1